MRNSQKDFCSLQLSAQRHESEYNSNHSYYTIRILNFTHWTIFKILLKQNSLHRNMQHGHIFPWLIKTVAVLMDLRNELKHYAKYEGITVSSEKYLSDGKKVSNPDRSVS